MLFCVHVCLCLGFVCLLLFIDVNVCVNTCLVLRWGLLCFVFVCVCVCVACLLVLVCVVDVLVCVVCV